jgi:integrase
MAAVREVTKHGKRRFEVDLGRVSGKRVRRYVGSEKDAKKKAKDLDVDRKKLGDAWRDLEARKKWTILEILRDIEKEGVTLLEVWESWKSINLGGGAGITIEDSITQFLELKAEAGRRPLYLREAGYGLRLFAKGREGRDLASVTLGEVQKWLAGLEKSQATKQTLQSRLNSLFSWAVRQGYVAANPIGNMEKISVTKSDPQILTNDQCRKLIVCAMQTDKGLAKYFALSLFMGIRPEECQRLTDAAIDLERMTVTISGDAAKTRNRRIVTITEPAYRILEKTMKEDYKVNFRKRLVVVRKAAKLKKWPKDVLRHTAASHFHNTYTMDEATKQLGHSADVMLRHYRQMVTKEETEAWLEI